MNGSRFLNAASAIAMTAGVLTSAGTMVLVSPVAAEAAVIRNISVRGAERTGADTVVSRLTIVPGKNL